MFLQNYLPRLSQFLSVDKPLNNGSLLGMAKNPTIPLYSNTTKPEDFFDQKETIKNVKMANEFHAYIGYTSSYSIEVLISFNL